MIISVRPSRCDIVILSGAMDFIIIKISNGSNTLNSKGSIFGGAVM